jgi:Xaa-Pro aminopeptidase
VVFVGQPTAKQKEIYDLVLRAQMLGISLVKPGGKTAFIDQSVRDFLKENTIGIYSHGLGHGVGLQIHEKPSVSIASKDILQAGMVITIEPGVYIENWGGIRLEDMVLVTESGYQVLSKASKKLSENII